MYCVPKVLILIWLWHLFTLILDISPKGFNRSASYQSNIPSALYRHASLSIILPPLLCLLSGSFLSHIRHMDICYILALLSYFDAMARAEHVLTHSICMITLLWYGLVSKSKPRHKLARLPAFKENTLINFHSLWNAGFLFEFCGLNFSSFSSLVSLFFLFLSFSVPLSSWYFSQSAFLLGFIPRRLFSLLM